MRGRVLKAFWAALFATALLGHAQTCLAAADWANLAVSNTLTSGDICTTDGVYINCTTAPTTTINSTPCTLGGSCSITISGSSVTLIVGTTPISGGATGQLVYQDSSNKFDEMANVVWQSPFLGLGTATASAQLHIAGANAISASAWTTNGIRVREDAQTYTDTSSSGTQSSSMYFDVIGQPTLAASNATTYANAATMYIAGPPIGGTNATITNAAALVVGIGNVGIGTTSPSSALTVVDTSGGQLRLGINAGGIPGSISGGQTSNSFNISAGSWSNGNISLTPYGAGGGLYLNYNGTSGNGGLYVYDGGTSNVRMVVQSGGNVGIGTTGPTQSLDVAGYIKASSGSITPINNGGLYLSAATAGVYTGASGSNLVSFANWNNAALGITLNTSTGNVGIGTTNPGNTLDVNGTGIHIASGTPSSTSNQLYNVGGALTWNGNTVASGTFVNLQSATPGTQQTGNLNISGTGLFGGNVGIGTTDPSEKLSVYSGGTNTNVWATYNSANGMIGRIYNSNSNGGLLSLFDTGGNEKVRLYANPTGTAVNYILGNVGIGTTSPVTSLEVRANASWFNGLQIDNIGSTGGSPFLFLNGSTTNWGVGVDTGDSNKFKIVQGAVPGSSSGNRYFTIDTSGNVGIGTTGPQRTLEINSAGALRLDNAGNGIEFLQANATDWELNTVGTTTSFSFPSGNVGIGTTSPISPFQIAVGGSPSNTNLLTTNAPGTVYHTQLHFNSDGSGALYAYDGTTSNNVLGYFGSNQTVLASGGTYTWSNSATNVSALDSGLSRGAAGKIYVGNGTQGDYSGTLIASNVGIGTTSPGSTLDVSGNIHISGYYNGPLSALTGTYILGDWGNNSGGFFGTNDPNSVYLNNIDGIAYYVNGGGSVEYPGVRYGLQKEGTWNIADGGTVAGSFVIYTSSGGSSSTLPTLSEKFRVTSTGNVGIGTTSPDQSLEVVGNAHFMPSSSTNGDYMEFINSGGTSYFGVSGATSTFGFGETAYATLIGTLGAKPIQFATNSTVRATIDYTGNVGIGTTSPSTALQVSGTVTATQFSGSGVGLSTGTVPIAALNTSGTASSTTFLNGLGQWATPSGSGSGTPGGSNTQIQYNNSGSFGGAVNHVWNSASGFLGLGTATASAQFHIAGANAISVPAWTTSGIGIRQDAQTYTDNSSTATQTYNFVDVIGQPTLTTTHGGVTYTNAATMYIAGAPVAGTNVVIGNPAALVVGSGNVGIGTTAPGGIVEVYNSVSNGLSSLKVNNPTTGSTTQAQVNFATGTSNSSATLNLQDNSGSPSMQYAVGSGVTKTYYNSPIHIFRAQGGSAEWMRLNSTGLGIGTNAPGAQLEIANAPISAAWGTNGLGLRVDAETLTDSNSPTGTVTYNMANTIGVPTLTTVSNTVTYTNAATLYIAGAPAQGSRVTITNPMALYVGAGTSVFGGNVGIGTTGPGALLDLGVTTSNNVQAILTRGGDANFQLYAANGAVGNTSGTLEATFGLRYAGTGDAATMSFYRGGSAQDSTMAFNTNGSERMRINSAGNVGIGTTGPSQTLDVNGTFGVKANNNAIYLTDSGGAERRSILLSGANTYYYGDIDNANNSSMLLQAGGSGSFSFNTNASTKVVISNGGNVGIGSTSPSQNLTVAGTASVTGELYVNNNITGIGSGSTGTIQLGDSTISKTYGSGFLFGSSVSASSFNGSGSGLTNGTVPVAALVSSSTTVNGVGCALGGSCTITVSGSGVTLTVGTTPISGGTSGRLVYQDTSNNFDEAANVIWQSPFLGLGTGTASAQLHIAGANAISAPAWTTNGIRVREDAQTYTDTSSSGTQSSPMYFDMIGAPTLGATHATTYANAATLYIAGAPLGGSNATISNAAALVVGSGNVGIGTTAPGALLHVNEGNAIISSYSNGAPTLTLKQSSNCTNGDCSSYTSSMSMGYNFSHNFSLVGVGGNELMGGYYGNLALMASSGNVGIGTNSPGYTLDVNGTANVRGTANVNDIYFLDGGSYNGLSSDHALSQVYGNFDRDLFAFNAPNTYETYNGSTWSSTTVPTSIFTGNSAGGGSLTVANGTPQVRFTWSGFGYRWWDALIFAHSTNGNNFTATLQWSTDGSTFTNFYTTPSYGSWPGYSVYKTSANNSGKTPYLRLVLTFTWSNGNPVNFY